MSCTDCSKHRALVHCAQCGYLHLAAELSARSLCTHCDAEWRTDVYGY